MMHHPSKPPIERSRDTQLMGRVWFQCVLHNFCLNITFGIAPQILEDYSKSISWLALHRFYRIYRRSVTNTSEIWFSPWTIPLNTVISPGGLVTLIERASPSSCMMQPGSMGGSGPHFPRRLRRCTGLLLLLQDPISHLNCSNGGLEGAVMCMHRQHMLDDAGRLKAVSGWL